MRHRRQTERRPDAGSGGCARPRDRRDAGRRLSSGLMTYPAPGTRLKSEAFLTQGARSDRRGRARRPRWSAPAGRRRCGATRGSASPPNTAPAPMSISTAPWSRAGTCGWDDCALTVLATVVSRPTAERALIDAGSKALTMDLLGLEGYGVVHALGDAPIYALNEEHGYLDISNARSEACGRRPRPGRPRTMSARSPTCSTGSCSSAARTVLGAVKVDARGAVQ